MHAFNRWLPSLVLALQLAGCASNVDLYVDVVTDLRPGTDFTSVRVTLGALQAERDATPGDPFADGVRVAEFGPLVPANYAFAVELLRGDAVVLRQGYDLLIAGSRVEVVLLASRCVGVTCPGADDPADATACRAGLCINPSCLERPGSCAAECETDAQCAGEVSCVVGRCIEQTCFFNADDSLCPSAERCDPVTGCFGGALVGDPCASQADCGDSLICCGGRCELPGCDDGNACTDDACAPDGCTHDANVAPCDDGVYCNGLDSCAGGSCVESAGDPCEGATLCDETRGECVGCREDTDCPAATERQTGSCVFADLCDEGGTETWTVTSYRCVADACVAQPQTEERPCTRSTTGISCGGVNEVCSGGSCRCGPGPTCGAGQTCYPDGRCGAAPTFTPTGLPTPACSDFGLAPSPSSLAGYLVTGRPGARVRKFNRHVSCGGGWSEASETATTPTFLDGSGEYLLEIRSASAISCDLGTLGQWESYAEVDGVRVPAVGTVLGTIYHSGCPATATCAMARSYCPAP